MVYFSLKWTTNVRIACICIRIDAHTHTHTHAIVVAFLCVACVSTHHPIWNIFICVVDVTASTGFVIAALQRWQHLWRLLPFLLYYDYQSRKQAKKKKKMSKSSGKLSETEKKLLCINYTFEYDIVRLNAISTTDRHLAIFNLIQ